MTPEYVNNTLIVGATSHDFMSLEEFADAVAGDEEARSFYKRLGRGDFCDVFSLGTIDSVEIDNLDLNDWNKQGFEQETAVNVISWTSDGVDIGFSPRNGFCVLNLNEPSLLACTGFGDALSKASKMIGRPHLLDFPFHISPNVSGKSYLVSLGDNFAHRFQEEQPKLLQHYYANQEECYLGTFSTLISSDLRYSAQMLTGPSMSTDKEGLLKCRFAAKNLLADYDEIVNLLANVTNYSFEVIRAH